MAIFRSPDVELLEDLVREAADDTTGLLVLPRKREYIQREYEQRIDSWLNAPTVSHRDIRDVLEQFAEDEKKDIEHAGDEAYYVNPFVHLDDVGRDQVEQTIIYIYQTNVVFDAESLREAFSIPRGYEDFFIESLEREHDLIKRITSRRDVFTIGSKLEQKTDATSVEERIRVEAGDEGIVSNTRFEKIVTAPVIDEVIQLFEDQGYVIDLDGAYLVREATDDHARYLADEIHDDVVDLFEESDHLLLESTFENEVERKAKAASDALPEISDPSIRDEIIDGTEAKLRNDLNIEPRHAGDDRFVVMGDVLAEEIEKKARTVFETVETVDSAVAEKYYEIADEQIEGLSIEGGKTKNRYFRDNVRGRVHEMIKAEIFGRDGGVRETRRH